ncbi:MAG: aminopeptidase [Candidatus Bathyarchaeia archaeon]|jgi:leucyl aminopeptidase (aminopeptidase T)
MVELYEYEIAKAANILATQLFNLKTGETIIITADTESDSRVVNAAAAAAFAAGAKPMVIWLASPLEFSKGADPMLPIEALTAALKETDAWLEFNSKGLLYSTPYEIAERENKKLRYLCLDGMDVDMMVRCLGRVDYPALKMFETKLRAMTKAAKHMKITTPAGTDVEFDNNSKNPMTLALGYADTPGSHMLGGQIGWAPEFDSINGDIVFDGFLMPVALLKEPVKIGVKKGKIVNIEGGREATEFEAWLRSWKDPRMFKMAHVCYGCNPGAKLTPSVLEMERIWGATEWGIGYVGPMLTADGKPIDAPCHSDGLCQNSSVWLDNKQIMDKGKMIHPELSKLAKRLGKE